MLSELQVRRAVAREKPYKLTDGAGMYLLVNSVGRYWRLDYRFEGKRKTMSLGVYPAVSLVEARARRDDARKTLGDGRDPCAEASVKKVGSTLRVIAEEWFERRSPGWAPSHASKVRIRLDNDLLPWLGDKEISQVTAPQMLSALRRVEARGAVDTAHRCLQYLQAIGRYAVATGRAVYNPAADLRGALATAVNDHYASIIDPERIGPLLRAIDEYHGDFATRCALRLAPLVFVRPGELRSAEWDEFNLETAEWKIPGAKMKMRTAHIVPLSRQALAVVKDIHPLTGNGKFLFPSNLSPTRPMSDNTVNTALRRMGYTKEEMTGHGFRSMASTLLHELGWHHDLIELQLAHTKRDKVSAAYNYALHIPERRVMMQAWSDYLDQLRRGVVLPTGATAFSPAARPHYGSVPTAAEDVAEPIRL